jgi:hypothetical protein
VISEPDPAPPAPEVIADPDGRRAAAEALARGPRTAVWVGDASDPAIEEFRAEIGHRR